MTPGTRVRITSDRLPHYSGKIGTVMELGVFPGKSVHVSFHPGSYAWFYPRELGPSHRAVSRSGTVFASSKFLGSSLTWLTT